MLLLSWVVREITIKPKMMPNTKLSWLRHTLLNFVAHLEKNWLLISKTSIVQQNYAQDKYVHNRSLANKYKKPTK